MKHLFFFGDGLVGVASEDDALDGDAGKSERGVAWTSPPIANTTDREREGGVVSVRSLETCVWLTVFLERDGDQLEQPRTSKTKEQCFM